MEIVLALLPFIAQLLKYGFEWLLNRGKVSDETKKDFQDAMSAIIEQRRRQSVKIKKLEKRLELEHKKMDDILAGKRKFAWQKKGEMMGLFDDDDKKIKALEERIAALELEKQKTDRNFKKIEAAFISDGQSAEKIALFVKKVCEETLKFFK